MLIYNASLLWSAPNKVLAISEKVSGQKKVVIDVELLEVKEEEGGKLEKLISFMQPKTLEKVFLPEKYHILADEF